MITRISGVLQLKTGKLDMDNYSFLIRRSLCFGIVFALGVGAAIALTSTA
ncbi:hypothetical protein GS682_31080 [Nostoc sp. B(2019)]|nr:hypothetical protein [Nostoc sp. B(2019)]